MPTTDSADSAEFELYDLRVEVVGPPDRTIYCGAKLGNYFELHGEMLKLPPGQGFSIYSLAALLPLLPAKQRMTDPNDWMSTDAQVACPDPNCPTRFRITRSSPRRFTIIDRSLTRLGMERLDLVQFHWWDFAIPRPVSPGVATPDG
jgi:uncharacterized repeat protein (TIGR04076 family)